MLKQGDAPKSALLEEFRLTPNAVLFATSSFWQGVDVQGEQLSCVIIDRLPFAVPSDPVVAARVKAIDAEGGNAFFRVSGAGGGDHAEAGIRAADPLAARSRVAGAARQPHSEEAIRPRVCGEFAEVQADDGYKGGRGVLWAGKVRHTLYPTIVAASFVFLQASTSSLT